MRKLQRTNTFHIGGRTVKLTYGRSSNSVTTEQQPTVVAAAPVAPKQMQMERATAVPPPAVALAPGESVVLPTKELQRVFLGLGWNNTAEGTDVDLDCSVVGYDASGMRDEQNTVWYGNLRNGVHLTKKKGSSIVHTGDILTGAKCNLAQIQTDMERIYVWLEAVPTHLATIAFAVDAFTPGVTFASLSNAYCRVVNADTGQELARLTLTPQYLGPLADSSVMLLARLRRLGNGLWALQASAEPRASTLRCHDGPQADMVTYDALPLAVASPEPLAVAAVAVEVAEPEVAAAVPVGMPPQAQAQGGVARDGGGGASPQQAQGGKLRGRSWAVPALAMGTAGGVAAATAIFMTTNEAPLSNGMLDDSLFSSGVDFANLVPVDVSAAGEFFAGGIESAGEVGQGVGEAASAAVSGASDLISSAGEALSGAISSAGEAIGNAGEAVGTALGNAGEAIAEAIERVSLSDLTDQVTGCCNCSCGDFSCGGCDCGGCDCACEILNALDGGGD